MNSPTDASFPVVALGGSAGGLAAFTAFLSAVDALETPPGMAFIVIPHLSPTEESHMADLLQRHIRLPTTEVTEATEIEPDHVYVLRPNEMLTIHEGRLVPHARNSGRAHHPVDDIFYALGAEMGRRGAAIVLSGTGRNGSAGLTAVHEHGGLVLAQSLETAEFEDMPRHAIETDLVDSVLAPGAMIDVLQRAAQRLGDASRPPPVAAAEDAGSESAAYRRILAVARARTEIDFADYKPGTLSRRIDRRVLVNQCASWAAYADFVESDEAEQQALAADLLITVTGFFRDNAAWEELRETAARPMIRDRQTDTPLRVWVAGCASGEEAYSLAILLFEEAEAQGREIPFEIFATDASGAALAHAREGLYPAAAVQHLSPERRARFFTAEDDSVRIKRWLREAVLFAPHDLLADPPFSRLDLVICRNLLIYLETHVQQRLLRLFHFCLSEGGFLFLGSAENLGDTEDQFDTPAKGSRLYRRRGPTRRDLVNFPVVKRRSPAATPQAGKEHGAQSQTAELALRALANRHAPPAVMIDENFQVLYYQGALNTVLLPQAGEPSQDLLALAREGLGPRIRRLVQSVAANGETESEQARLKDPEGATLRIEVSPVDGNDGAALFLVTFAEEPGAAPPPVQAHATREAELEAEIEVLHEELGKASSRAARAEEDHRAYNEEIVSMNEELRATNEELETSKEELQSLNEEVNTVNSQLRAKLKELQQRTADLQNLLSNTGIATLFLDADFAIRWFSPGLAQMFNIRPADTERPISDLVPKFDDDTFLADCERALDELSAVEKEVRAGEDTWYLRRIAPYRATDDRIEGVCITFTDISEIYRARRYAEQIVETAPAPLLVLDSEMRVVSASAAFYETFQTTPAETENRLIYHLGDGQWNIPSLQRLLGNVLPDNEVFHGYEVEHRFETAGEKTMLLSGRKLDDQQRILLVIQDITERKAWERQQDMLMSELGHRVKNALTIVQSLASQTLNRSESLAQFRVAFEGRLAAFARGHTQLLSRNWEATDLRRLIQGAIEAHAVDPRRVTLDGPEVEIAPQPALALTLGLHELETNATKYGALSTGDGHIDVRWSLDEAGNIRLVWQEVGGPAVAPPEGAGFGTQLIEQLVAQETAGDARLSYPAEGVRCVLTFPRHGTAGPQDTSAVAE